MQGHCGLVIPHPLCSITRAAHTDVTRAFIDATGFHTGMTRLTFREPPSNAVGARIDTSGKQNRWTSGRPSDVVRNSVANAGPTWRMQPGQGRLESAHACSIASDYLTLS